MATLITESERAEHNAARTLLRYFRNHSWIIVDAKLDELDAEGTLHFSDRDALRRYAKFGRTAYTPADQSHCELLAYRVLVPYLFPID